MVKPVDATLVKSEVIGMDHTLHRVDAGIGQYGFQGMNHHRYSHQWAVLLRQASTGPMAATGCNQNKRHR
jgi:hypothetical protein